MTLVYYSLVDMANRRVCLGLHSSVWQNGALRSMPGHAIGRLFAGSFRLLPQTLRQLATWLPCCLRILARQGGMG